MGVCDLHGLRFPATPEMIHLLHLDSRLRVHLHSHSFAYAFTFILAFASAPNGSTAVCLYAFALIIAYAYTFAFAWRIAGVRNLSLMLESPAVVETEQINCVGHAR